MTIVKATAMIRAVATDKATATKAFGDGPTQMMVRRVGDRANQLRYASTTWSLPCPLMIHVHLSR